MHSNVEELERDIHVQKENSETISGTRPAKKSESGMHSSPKPSTVGSKQAVSKSMPAPEAFEDFDDGDDEDDSDGDEDGDDSVSYVSCDGGEDKEHLCCMCNCFSPPNRNDQPAIKILVLIGLTLCFVHLSGWLNVILNFCVHTVRIKHAFLTEKGKTVNGFTTYT